MKLCCCHCERPTIDCPEPPAGWQDVVPLCPIYAVALSATHVGVCPACDQKRRPKPWESPEPKEKTLF